ncbi:hypothetical protein AgCh_025585 [Apium graveolens]
MVFFRSVALLNKLLSRAVQQSNLSGYSMPEREGSIESLFSVPSIGSEHRTSIHFDLAILRTFLEAEEAESASQVKYEKVEKIGEGTYGVVY